jgi:hypothetical protein
MDGSQATATAEGKGTVNGKVKGATDEKNGSEQRLNA